MGPMWPHFFIGITLPIALLLSLLPFWPLLPFRLFGPFITSFTQSHLIIQQQLHHICDTAAKND